LPDLDFTDVLESGEFEDCITVTTVSGVVGSGGLDVDTKSAPKPMDAIVVPGKADLHRLDDGSRVTAFILVFVCYPLSAGSKTNDTVHREPDIVTWHGRRYTVMSVEDYSAFGRGFVKASCDLLDLSPT
jgi:galactose-6-phosphate isomerase